MGMVKATLVGSKASIISLYTRGTATLIIFAIARKNNAKSTRIRNAGALRGQMYGNMTLIILKSVRALEKPNLEKEKGIQVLSFKAGAIVHPLPFLPDEFKTTQLELRDRQSATAQKLIFAEIICKRQNRVQIWKLGPQTQKKSRPRRSG